MRGRESNDMISSEREVSAVLYVVPDYYRDFRCIAGACQHSCCIGWEIDIDDETATYYRTLDGALGDRLREHIAWEDPPHFVLGEKERCPFLNGHNLCDIITELGEERLCGICSDHPRFRNELPGRIETGIGLCCEEAARLILSRKEPVRLLAEGEDEAQDEILALRDEVILLLQERTRPVSERVEEMLRLCGASVPKRTTGEWCEFLLTLERLDETWTKELEHLRDSWQGINLYGFDQYMVSRQTEYEQLLVYLVYRHLANAADEVDLAARAAFAAWGFELVRILGALTWQKTGELPFARQQELARLFSSELEYSEENLEQLLDVLAWGEADML